ncbi:MAG: hypothetical protein AB1393_14165 [Candidatus Edwardsbacteria bacterium]
MAEFCKHCFYKYEIAPVNNNETLILSKEKKFCEGCGQIKRIVVRIVEKRHSEDLRKKSNRSG